MSQEKLFYVGVKGLIKNDQGKLLLLLADVTHHRKNTEPYWDIPGGRIQEGASVLETLKREIREEIGLQAESPHLLATVMSNHHIPMEDDRLAGLVLMVYTVNVPNAARIVLSEEHTAYEWVSSAEAKQRLQHKYPSEFINLL